MTAVINAAGLALLKREEGCVLHPYNDSSQNATIGIGHLIHLGPYTEADVERYRGFTLAQAEQLLYADLAIAIATVDRYITRSLNGNQRAVTIDITFNCGGAPLLGRVGQLINAGDFTGAADAMLAWCHDSNGQVVPGLLARRQADRALFLTPVVVSDPLAVLWPAERAEAHVYLALKRSHPAWHPRALKRARAAVVRTRKLIWHDARPGTAEDWARENRAARYAVLKTITQLGPVSRSD